eukprot:1434000-Rhodomonas_salina.2
MTCVGLYRDSQRRYWLSQTLGAIRSHARQWAADGASGRVDVRDDSDGGGSHGVGGGCGGDFAFDDDDDVAMSSLAGDRELAPPQHLRVRVPSFPSSWSSRRLLPRGSSSHNWNQRPRATVVTSSCLRRDRRRSRQTWRKRSRSSLRSSQRSTALDLRLRPPPPSSRPRSRRSPPRTRSPLTLSSSASIVTPRRDRCPCDAAELVMISVGRE